MEATSSEDARRVKRRLAQAAAVLLAVAGTAALAAPMVQRVNGPAKISAERLVAAARPTSPEQAWRLVWRGADVDHDGQADFANPTGHGIRKTDAYGCGDFGATRDGGERRHEGVDFIADAGQRLVAPISGYVTKIGFAYPGDNDLKFVEIKDLSPSEFKFAHLTGTDTLNPTDDQIAAMKHFVESGGTLLIDAAGGSGAFADAEAAWLPKVLGDAKLQPVQGNDPLFHRTIDGTVEAPPKSLRLYAMEQLHSDSPRLKSATAGKGRVIFTPLDLASGLLGTNTWGIVGYLPDYSQALIKNAVLLANFER